MSPLLEAALLADRRAEEAILRRIGHVEDLDTAETALSALGSAASWLEADREAMRWVAIAAKLREAAQ